MTIKSLPVKSAPWLACDKAWRLLKYRKFQIRLNLYGQRLSLIPMLDINWEQGMATLALGWLNLQLMCDYDFDPAYASSDEVEYPLIRE